MTHGEQAGRGLSGTIGLIGGPVVSLAVLLLTDLDPGNPLVTRTAAVAILMAIWWMTEAIPIPVTALLPVAVFPLLGVMSGADAAALYFNHIIFLFVGGFLIALAMQRWQLHRRIALRIILLLGTGPRRLLLGFMVATAFLSMWISNTATRMMMIPMAVAIVSQVRDALDKEKADRYARGLLIGIAYAASIGGIGTLIGTPPNLAFARIYTMSFPNEEVSFASWFLFALPLSIAMLSIAWVVLGRLSARGVERIGDDRKTFLEAYRALGPMRYEEKVVLVMFSTLAFLWLFRADLRLGFATIPGWTRLLPNPAYVKDGTVAIAVALLLFVIRSRSRSGQRLLGWNAVRDLNWGIVLLFGGGFALAGGIMDSGLSTWLGSQLTGLSGVPSIVLVGSICLSLTFLTELTSNTATTEMILPVLASLALAIDVHPMLLMVPATLSASCAFMLPVATPPNAIAFGTGELRIKDMVRSGIILNLVGVVLITLAVFVWGRIVLGFGG